MSEEMLNWIFLIVLLIVAILAILFNLHARKSKNSPTVKNSHRLNKSTSNHTLSHSSTINAESSISESSSNIDCGSGGGGSD